MTVRPPRWLPALGLVAVALAASRADDPAAGPRREPADDAFPKGAIVRLGPTRSLTRVAAVLPPDYKTCLGSDSRGSFRRYDLATARPLSGGNVGLSAGHLLVSADGTRAVSTSTGPLKVHDATTGKLVREIKTPASTPTEVTLGGTPPVAISADGKVVAQAASGFNRTSRDKLAGLDVYVWDVEKNAELVKITAAQTRHVTPLLSADATILVTRGEDVYVPQPAPPAGGPARTPTRDDGNRLVQVWEVATGKELARLRPAGITATTVAVSPDGKAVAVSCGTGLVEVWDARTGKAIAQALGRTGQGRQVAFSPDGKTLAAVGADGSIQRWATADGRQLGTTEFPVPFLGLAAAGVTFADADRVVAWGTVGAVAVAWESPSGKLLTPLGEHLTGIKSVALPPGGKQVVTAGFDGRIVRWDAATGKPVREVGLRRPRFPESPYQFVRPVLELSADGRRGISHGVAPGVYDTETGTELFALPPDRSGRGMAGLCTSPDHSRIAVFWSPSPPRTKELVVAVWDLAASRKLVDLELPGPGGFGTAAAFSPDGTRLVTASPATDPTGRRTTLVTGWDLKTGKKLGEFDEPSWAGQVHLTAANNTSALLINSAGEIWGLDYEGGRKGELIDKRTGGTMTGVAFSPDGTRFAAGTFDPKSGLYGPRIYDWPRGTALHTFAGHGMAVTAVTFSADGKTLATGSQDTTVILWDMAAIKK